MHMACSSHFKPWAVPIHCMMISFLLGSFSGLQYRVSASREGDGLLLWTRRPGSLLDVDASPWLPPASNTGVFVGPQQGLKAHDKIARLPGQPNGADRFAQYGGYVTVDPAAGRALFYYFVESPGNSSATNPLVLWLNGGPGCSSLGYGAMLELGPFRVNKDGKTLTANPHAWNEVANIIFLESPAGVGFSYSNRTQDYDDAGDRKTAQDTYTFLLNWFERFPEYKTREFFVAGESYAGHYVPQLARTILFMNNCTNHTHINLKGVAIGNAYIDEQTNSEGTYDFLWTHGLNSDDTHSGILSNCNFSQVNLSAGCAEYTLRSDGEKGNVDIYNIYAPLCDTTKNSTAAFDPCSENYVVSYLNLPEVQNALHANVTAISYPWRGCSDYILYHWNDRPRSVLRLFQQLIDLGLSIWLYSGDVDSVVSVTSTRYGIKSMGLKVMSDWRPWYLNNEVGGYVLNYKGLNFTTVRGAGHMVPSDQPDRALALFSSILRGISR